MPFIATETVAQMRKAIKAALPEYKISVTKLHHSTVKVNIMEGPIVGVDNVNVFWYKDHFGPEKLDRPDVVKVVETILGEIKRVEAPRIVSEDGDYGSIPNFYYDVDFGKWDKPYVCSDPDARDKLEIQQVFRQIDRVREQEARYQQWKAEHEAQQRQCGIVTLAPDDLRIPCVLPMGHAGFCDTGR